MKIDFNDTFLTLEAEDDAENYYLRSIYEENENHPAIDKPSRLNNGYFAIYFYLDNERDK